MDRETATKLAHELVRGVSNPPDVDDTVAPAIEAIPDFDAHVRDRSSKRVLVLAPPFVFIAGLDESVTVEALPATERDIAAINVSLTAGRLYEDAGRVLTRKWSFEFCNGRTIHIEGEEAGGFQNEEEKFARTLAGALGWRSLKIAEEAS